MLLLKQEENLFPKKKIKKKEENLWLCTFQFLTSAEMAKFILLRLIVRQLYIKRSSVGPFTTWPTPAVCQEA